MSRDDFLDAAIEAGVVARDGCGYFVCSDDVDEILNLAALVAVQEREACAQVAEAKAPEFGEKGWAAKDRGDLQLALGMLGVEFQLKDCAAAIRARGTP